MGKFLIEGKWYVAESLEKAKEQHQQAKGIPMGGKPANTNQSNAMTKAKPQWQIDKERMDNERNLKQQKTIEVREYIAREVAKFYPIINIDKQPGDNMFFRACALFQQPWDLLKTDGFTHRSGNHDQTKLKAFLAEIYSKKHNGARNYMANYRVAAQNNPANCPFISAGIKPKDGAGAASSHWQYAIQVPKLIEMKVTGALLGVADSTLSDDIGDVRLLVDNENLDSANVMLLLHGPLPEATFLNRCPASLISAWTRLGGDRWMQEFRRFDAHTVMGIKKLVDDHKEWVLSFEAK